MGIPSTIPQGCLLRAGQELPTLGFPSLPQPSQSLPGSVTLHWGRLSACREPPGTEEPASVHSPAVRLRWEHFLGDGAGSMLARQPGHPLLLLPSHELPATDRGAPQHTAVCCRYAVLGQSKVPRPQSWGARRAAECSCFGKGQAILLAAVWWLRAAFVQWRFSQLGGLRTSAQGEWQQIAHVWGFTTQGTLQPPPTPTPGQVQLTSSRGRPRGSSGRRHSLQQSRS